MDCLKETRVVREVVKRYVDDGRFITCNGKKFSSERGFEVREPSPYQLESRLASFVPQKPAPTTVSYPPRKQPAKRAHSPRLPHRSTAGGEGVVFDTSSLLNASTRELSALLRSYTIIIPWIVVCELDRHNAPCEHPTERQKALKQKASQVRDWLIVASNPANPLREKLILQSRSELDRTFVVKCDDDRVVQCASYYLSSLQLDRLYGCTEDKFLSIKLQTEGLSVVSWDEIRRWSHDTHT